MKRSDKSWAMALVEERHERLAVPGQSRPLEYILPVIATRTVTTTVCVRAGRTIMLGALGGGGLEDAKVVAVLLRMTRQTETGLVHGQSS